MNIQAPFTLASVYPLGVWRSLGLRLRGLRQFQAFLASSPCAASAGSSVFRSPWPVRSLSFLRFGSNPALKPTRILRAAYLGRWGAPFRPSGLTVRRSRPPTAAAELRALVPVNLTLQSSWFFHRPSPSHAFIRWVFGRVSGFACNHFASFKSFLPPAHASQARAAIGLVALCIHAPFHRRG